MFRFKQFSVVQERSAMKVTTDACLFGAWVAEDLRPEINMPLSVLDIGSGTGLLSLMIAQKCERATIDAIELDENAFEETALNFKNSPWTERLNAIRADARAFSSSKKYQVLVSNPPFYENELSSPVAARQMAHHGSSLQLSTLIGKMQEWMEPEGKYYILLPFRRQAEIKQLLFDKDLSISKLIFVRQSPKHSYFRAMITGGQNISGETEVDEICIREDGGEYSAAFTGLLKEYYLYL